MPSLQGHQRELGLVWFFFFYHSSVNFRHSSLTINNRLKIHNLFDTILHLSSINIFYTIYVLTPVTCSEQTVLLAAEGFPPIFFSFLIFPFPFSHVTLPKHKPEPIKISQAPSPRQDRHQWMTNHLSDVYGGAISSVMTQRRRRA